MSRIQWIGGILFTALGVASLLLYRERVLYVDSAYYAFNMINEGHPAAEHNRYAMYIYQFIPWIMLKLHAPIPAILKVFSLCHILVHALVFALLLRTRQYGLAALLAIMQVLSYRECFFLAVNETALAISASLMLAGLLNYYQGSRLTLMQALWYLLCVLVGMFSHPMAMVLMPFVMVYHFIRYRPDTKSKPAILIIGFILVFLVKKLTSHASSYEADLYAQLRNSFEIISHLGDVYSFNFFFGEFKINAYFFNIYFIPLSLAIFAIWRLRQIGQPRLLIFYILSLLGSWLLIVILFNRGDGNMFMEKNFTPWVMIALYPWIHLLKYESGKMPAMPVVVYVLIIGYSISGIYRVAPMYRKRQQLMQQLITEKNPARAPKLLMQDSAVDHEKWLAIWALPYETLLLGKVLEVPNVTARIYRNEESVNKELGRPDIFLGADFIPPLPATYLLNQQYFKLEEKPYLPIDPP